jgi:ribosomal protein S18 acetylase RimI-like enzyme
MNNVIEQQHEVFVELDPDYYMCNLPEHDTIFSQVIDLYQRTFLTCGQDETPVDKIVEIFLSGRYKVYTLLRNNKQNVVALAIISMLAENQDFCHLDYICVDEKARGGGTGSRFMKDYLIPTLHDTQKNVTLECEPHIMGWYVKLGAQQLPLLDSIFAGRRYKFLMFERPHSDGIEQSISATIAERVMGELRVKFHGYDAGDMSAVVCEDAYHWELLE